MCDGCAYHRAALVTLEQECLVKTNETGGYLVRQFTPGEVADAIAVRGHLEGMAARLVAEHGVAGARARLERDLDHAFALRHVAQRRGPGADRLGPRAGAGGGGRG